MSGAPIRFIADDAVFAPCKPEDVIAILRDPATWPRFQPEIVTVEGPSPLDQDDDVTGHARMFGFSVAGRSEAIAVESQRFVEDAVIGVRMVIAYTVEPTDTGCRIEREMTAYLPSGPLGTILSFFLKRRLKRMQRGVLTALAAQASEGS